MINIEVSGKYYHELKKVFLALISDGESKEQILSRFTTVLQGKVETPQDHMLHLMYVLINEIEDQAVKNNLTEEDILNVKFPEN